MSRYTSNGKRRSSMTHARRSWTCPCGRTVWGNGGKASHKRGCVDAMEEERDVHRHMADYHMAEGRPADAARHQAEADEWQRLLDEKKARR